jgi:uncharacterized protein (TIGR03000 family)
MRAYNATRKQWRRKIIAGALIVLGLAVIGLPNGQAQMRYNGGFIQHHRHPPPTTLSATTTPPPSATKMPPSYFPDNDSYYPSFSSATTSVTRSNPGEEFGNSLSSFGVSAAVIPWNQAGFEEYRPFPETNPEPSPAAPRKYALEATPLLGASLTGEPQTAMLIVHLPEHAMLWVEGTWIPRNGQTSYFTSPALNPGKKYTYTVRVAWIEDGRWVNLAREVPIEAGLIQTLYLRREAPLNRQ